MASRFYNHIGNAVLFDWYSIEIKEEGEGDLQRKHVYFHSKLHKNMPRKLTFCFGMEFTDEEILKDHDVLRKWVEHFGPGTGTGQRRY